MTSIPEPQAVPGPAAAEYSDAQIDAFLEAPDGRGIADMMRYSAVGTAGDVRRYLEDFAAAAQADELVLAHASSEVADRLRSVELTADAMLGARV